MVGVCIFTNHGVLFLGNIYRGGMLVAPSAVENPDGGCDAVSY
jgi:hypothetical protein